MSAAKFLEELTHILTFYIGIKLKIFYGILKIYIKWTLVHEFSNLAIKPILLSLCTLYMLYSCVLREPVANWIMGSFV